MTYSNEDYIKEVLNSVVENIVKREKYWNDIPIGKQNAVTYTELIARWNMSERSVRKLLQELSAYDNGDDYILIRSAKNRGGFYRTNNADEINAFRTECLHKGKSIFAPVRKINRVLNNTDQINLNDILGETT